MTTLGTREPASAADKQPRRPGHIPGLDSIRFVLAACVVFGHLGIPLPGFLASHIFVRALIGNAFVGVAAVAAFFIVSGFCIHLPTARGQQLRLLPYFVRRQVRIGLPFAVLWIACSRASILPFLPVLWSLVCEEIYYLAYPLLLKLRSFVGDVKLFVSAVLLSLVVLIAVPHTGDFHGPGYALTWLLALPMWLSGCALAEWYEANARSASRVGGGRIWVVRVGVWMGSVVCLLLRFHSPIDYEYSLAVLAMAQWYWLRTELIYWRDRVPPAITEVAGRGSYSLYLTHLVGFALASSLGFTKHVGVGWAITLGFAALVAAAFHVLVERPSHQLAIRVSASFKPKVSGAAPTGSVSPFAAESVSNDGSKSL